MVLFLVSGRSTAYHVTKWGHRACTPLSTTRAVSAAAAMSTLAGSARPSPPPNLVTGQRRPVAYEAAAVAASYEDEERLITGNEARLNDPRRNPRAYYNNNNNKSGGLYHHSQLTHTNGHAALMNGNRKTEEVQQDAVARTYDSDLIVVLDMDECLIHSQFMSRHDVAAQWAHQVARRNPPEDSLFGGDYHPLGRVDSFKISLPDGDLVHVNKRPYLEEFLQQVTDHYETHVFTAAMEVYASPVLDTLDPRGTRFAKRWYRESCTYHEDVGAYVKDLSKLDLPKSHRTVLVDNNPLSFLANPSNGILVSNFYDDPSDNTLNAVVDLLHELNEMDDVRPELEKRFQLEEALQDVLNKVQKEEQT